MTVSQPEFIKTMSELKLAHHKKIHEAVPANLVCGLVSSQQVIHPQVVDGIPEVTVEDVFAHLPFVEQKKLKLIDVRRADEFNAELGHIPGATRVTLGEELNQYLQQE